MEAKHRILIIKLGAIGDVTIVSQTLQRLDLRKDHEIHWVIDGGLIPLAQELTKKLACKVIFYSFSLKTVTTGGFFTKLKKALELTKIIQQTKPHSIAILHRDLRYRLFSLLGSSAFVAQIKSTPISEYQNILGVFEKLGFPRNS